MCFEIFSPSDFVTNNWSGGTTTQLFIDPPTADYAKRDFNFRLSTAKVETEKSDFSFLPGVSRKLMILDGKIVINHENHYTKTLNKFDTDAFEGDWKTSAVGICTDFNLMTTGKNSGTLSALIAERNLPKAMNIPPCDLFFVYAYKGNVEIHFGSHSLHLSFQHLLLLRNPVPDTLTVMSSSGAELVVGEVYIGLAEK